MVRCKCLFSNQTYDHIKNLQKLFQRNSLHVNSSLTVELLLEYLIPGEKKLSPKEFFLIDDYFMSNPNFMKIFYDDLLMSATFDCESEPKIDA